MTAGKGIVHSEMPGICVLILILCNNYVCKLDYIDCQMVNVNTMWGGVKSGNYIKSKLKI